MTRSAGLTSALNAKVLFIWNQPQSRLHDGQFDEHSKRLFASTYFFFFLFFFFRLKVDIITICMLRMNRIITLTQARLREVRKLHRVVQNNSIV